MKARMKKGINIKRVVVKLVSTIIALYVGNEVIGAIAGIMEGSTGVFNNGFKLLGWNVTDGTIVSTSGGSTGLLTVVGIVGIASIVTEFVDFSF